jgi:hypothetical protein
MSVIWAKMGPTGTPKDLKEGIVWCLTEKTLKGSLHGSSATGKPIYKKTGCGKSITPIVKRN